MKYSEMRGSIRSGDLIAFEHEGWKSIADIESQIVKCVTQSAFSHVCVAWVVGGRVFLIEAVVPQVRLMPLSNRAREGFYWIPSEKPMTETELEFGLQWVGVGDYSKWEAILGELELLKIGASEKWECAELTIEMRKRSNELLGEKATPADVVKEALKNGYPLKYVEG